MKSSPPAPTGYQGNSNSASTNGTTMETPLIAVQPPKTADLQPSYAKLVSEDAETRNEHGWYGSMSMFMYHQTIPIFFLKPLKCNQRTDHNLHSQHTRKPRRFCWSYSMLCLLSKSI